MYSVLKQSCSHGEHIKCPPARAEQRLSKHPRPPGIQPGVCYSPIPERRLQEPRQKEELKRKRPGCWEGWGEKHLRFSPHPSQRPGPHTRRPEQRSGLTQFLLAKTAIGRWSPQGRLGSCPPKHSAGRKKPSPHEVRSEGFLHVRGRFGGQLPRRPGQPAQLTDRCATL